METCRFADGFGRRFRSEEHGEALESLCLCEELSANPQTEQQLVKRAARLESFRHPAVAGVRRIERLGKAGGSLVVVSEAVPGTRLADLLRPPVPEGPRFDSLAWITVFQRVVAAVAALHSVGRDVSHGAIGPERIIVRTDGEPVLVEPLLGPALEPLGMARRKLWTQYRVPVAPAAGTVRLDQRCDVLQLAVLALALGTGRILDRDDFPNRVPRLLVEVCSRAVPEEQASRRHALQSWLARALQLDGRSAFRSAIEAEQALALVVAEEREEPAVLEAAPPAGSEPPARSSAPWPLPPEPPAERAPEPYPPCLPCHVAQAPVVHAPVVHAAILHRPPSPAPLVHPAPGSAAWSLVGRGLRASSVAVGLITLWGATYLGARSYLGLNVPMASGVLIVDSRPAGLEVLVDGSSHGVTPTTLQLRPGDHTLALRGGRSTTLVPGHGAPRRAPARTD